MLMSLPPTVLGAKKFAHNARITFLAFSPDGSKIAATGFDHTVRIWETASGRELQRIDPGSKYGCGSLFFRPGGAELCALAVGVGPSPEGVWTDEIRTWSVETGAPVTEPIRVAPHLADWTVAPDARTAAAVAKSAIIVFDLITGRIVVQLQGTCEWASVQFSPGGTLLVASCGSELHGWETRQWRKVLSYRLKEGYRYFSLIQHEWLENAYAKAAKIKPKPTLKASKRLRLRDLVADDATLAEDVDCVLPPKYLFAADPDVFVEYTHFYTDSPTSRALRLWNLKRSPEPITLAGEDPVALSPDGQILAGVLLKHKGVIRLWNSATGAELTEMEGHRSYVSQVRFSPKGDELLSGGGDGSVCIWSRPDFQAENSLHFHDHAYHLSYSPDGTLMSVVDDAGVHLWSVEPRREIARLPSGAENYISALFHPTEPLLICGGPYSPHVSLWNYQQGICSPKQYIGCSKPFDYALSPDGTCVAVAHADPDQYTEGAGDAVTLWSIPDKQEIAAIRHRHGVISAAFSPDGRFLASGDHVIYGNDSAVRIWRLPNRELLAELPGHGTYVSTLTFSRDGRWMASAGDDGTIAVWATNTWTQAARIQANGGMVQCIAFSPDGTLLAAGLSNTSVAVFRLTDTASSI